MPTLNTQHLITLLGYIGIGFISGAVSHGFFSGTRSLVMALIGMALFIIAEFMKDGIKNYISVFVYGLGLSLCIGMVSGGLQHFLDSPSRSLWIIPVGFVGSYLIYAREHKLRITGRSASITALLTIISTAGLRYIQYIIPASWYTIIDHDHGHGQDTIVQHTDINHSHMDHGDMVDSELAFIALMIPHHQEAVDTSLPLNQNTTNPTLQQLTREIIDVQTREIAMMKQRLTTYYSGADLSGYIYTPMMRTVKVSNQSQREQIRLQDMILHHQGAIDMAKKVLTLNPRPEVASFAREVITAQSDEITIMQQLVSSSNTSMSDMSMMNHDH